MLTKSPLPPFPPGNVVSSSSQLIKILLLQVLMNLFLLQNGAVSLVAILQRPQPLRHRRRKRRRSFESRRRKQTRRARGQQNREGRVEEMPRIFCRQGEAFCLFITRVRI
jgi:hypothetical protein